MPTPKTQRLSGTTLLRSVRDDLAPYRERIEPLNKQVAIVRFTAADDDSPLRRFRMGAARISAEQKVKAFTRLGFDVDHQVLASTTSEAQFADLIAAFNEDPRTSATIVQFPPPPRLAPLVQRLAPGKDIDALLEHRSPHPACATAEGIARLVTAFTDDNPTVGRGVVRLLTSHGHQVQQRDAGDDLRTARAADIVVSATGQPHLLTPDHIRPHHRLVVDSGFMPQADGSVAGDLHPAAATIPQYVTRYRAEWARWRWRC